MERSRRIGIIPGNEAGRLLAGEAVRAITALGFAIETVEFDLGPDRYRRTGEVCPEEVVEALRSLDAVFVGAPPLSTAGDIPPGLLERGIVFRLRYDLDLHINLRVFRGIGPYRGIDLAIVRENSEGAYIGEGGAIRKGTRDEIATQGSVSTRLAVERCLRFAFALARGRGRRVTLAHKTRVLEYAGSLWQRTFEEVASEFPDVRTDYENIDTCCADLIENPWGYDVIATDNLFGDILSDVAGAAAHAVAHSGSAELNTARSGPSLFEPMHHPKGGAPHTSDGPANDAFNPLPALAAAAMVLDHLGDAALAGRISRAVLEVAELGAAQDLAGRALTDEVIARADR